MRGPHHRFPPVVGRKGVRLSSGQFSKTCCGPATGRAPDKVSFLPPLPPEIRSPKYIKASLQDTCKVTEGCDHRCHLVFNNFHHPRKKTLYFFPQPEITIHLFLVFIDFASLDILYNEIIQEAVFCVCFRSLSTVFLRLIRLDTQKQCFQHQYRL